MLGPRRQGGFPPGAGACARAWLRWHSVPTRRRFLSFLRRYRRNVLARSLLVGTACKAALSCLSRLGDSSFTSSRPAAVEHSRRLSLVLVRAVPKRQRVQETRAVRRVRPEDGHRRVAAQEPWPWPARVDRPRQVPLDRSRWRARAARRCANPPSTARPRRRATTLARPTIRAHPVTPTHSTFSAVRTQSARPAKTDAALATATMAGAAVTIPASWIRTARAARAACSSASARAETAVTTTFASAEIAASTRIVEKAVTVRRALVIVEITSASWATSATRAQTSA
jgi:hypothetical protein